MNDDTNIEDETTHTAGGHVVDASKAADSTVESAKDETALFKKEEQNTKDKRDTIRINELTDVNIFAFLIMLFTGKSDDDTINKLSQSLGLGDNLKGMMSAVRSGDMNAITAAARAYSSIDAKNVDWAGVNAVVDGDLIKHLKLREGSENEVYLDSRGHLTVGVGHRVTDADGLKLGDTISNEQVIKFLKNDSASSYNSAKSQAIELGINDKEFIAGLTSVNFQLGPNWNTEHKDTWALMKKGDFNGAITEAANSDWNDQTPVRVKDFQKVLAHAAEIHSGAIDAQAPENKNYLQNSPSNFNNEDGLYVAPPMGKDTIMTSDFGPRRLGMHAGVDFKTNHLDANGIVELQAQQPMVFLGSNNSDPRGYGIRAAYLLGYNDKGEAITAQYSHLQKEVSHLKSGDVVNPGDYIATTGKTGRITGPHLDFEIRVGAHLIDPEKAFTTDLSKSSNTDALITEAKNTLGSRAHSRTYNAYIAPALRNVDTDSAIASLTEDNQPPLQNTFSSAHNDDGLVTPPIDEQQPDPITDKFGKGHNETDTKVAALEVEPLNKDTAPTQQL